MIDGHIPNLLCRTSSIYPSRFTFLPLFSALRLSAILHGPHRWDPIALCLLGRVFISQLLSFEITRYVFEAESVLWPKIITLQDNFPYTTLSPWILLTSLLLSPISLEEVITLRPVLGPGPCTTSVSFPHPIPSFVDSSSFENGLALSVLFPTVTLIDDLLLMPIFDLFSYILILFH